MLFIPIPPHILKKNSIQFAKNTIGEGKGEACVFGQLTLKIIRQNRGGGVRAVRELKMFNELKTDLQKSPEQKITN